MCARLFLDSLEFPAQSFKSVALAWRKGDRLEAPIKAPIPDFGRVPDTPKRVLWKWSLVAAAVISVFLMWQCGSALHQGRSLSNIAARRFHQELNSGQYEQIRGR